MFLCLPCDFLWLVFLVLDDLVFLPECPEAGRGECSDVVLEEEAEEGEEALLVGLATGVLGVVEVSCGSGLGLLEVVLDLELLLGLAEDGLMVYPTAFA